MNARRLLPLALLLGALLLSACGGGGGGGGAEVSVTMRDSAFSEATITVPVGTTVTWTNEDSVPHTATADDDSFASGTLDNGGSFSFTFNEAGEFPYYCQFHGAPGGGGMSGTVIVTE